MTDLHCSNCGAVLQPTGHDAHARCPYCGAENMLDRATYARLAAGAPTAPPEVLARVRAALHAPDPDAHLGHLARRLRAALGQTVETETSGGLFTRARVTRVRAPVGEFVYEVANEGGRVVGKRAHVVRGIAIRSLELDAERLVEALAADLHQLGDQVMSKFLAG